MTEYVRLCPKCRLARPLTEPVCEGFVGGARCHWPLLDVLPLPASEAAIALAARECAADEAPPTDADTVVSDAPSSQCRNGHVIPDGDLICPECGEGPTEDAVATAAAGEAPTLFGADWHINARLTSVSAEADLYLVCRDGHAELALCKHYRRGFEPQTDLYPALRQLELAHAPKLLEVGQVDDRAYEIWEHFPLGALGDIPLAERSDPEFVRSVVGELGRALNALERANLRHLNVKPATILIRNREPLDLVLSDFNTATLAEFDLQVALVGQTTRYAAPETIVGTVTAASDWWSLGVICLEMLTAGRSFEGVHNRALLLHLVTRGLQVPDDLSAEWRELLMGLLTRDPSKRWRWSQVERWLSGERGIPHAYDSGQAATAPGPMLELGGRTFTSPDSFALAGADEANWEAAKELVLHGEVATWLEKLDFGAALLARFQRVSTDQSLDDDARLALALLVLNANIPLCFRGEIVTPAWLLSNPAQAIAWLKGSLIGHLRRLEREAWLVRLRDRADRVRSRIKEYGIPVNEEQLEIALLATSTSVLEARWREKRRLFPDTVNFGLSALYDRRAPSDEELIILVSASMEALLSADAVIEDAIRAANEAGIEELDGALARSWFEKSRREIFDALNERLRGFKRCGRDKADEWADGFRLERRISLSRALALLAIPETDWRDPPQQQYVQNVLTFFNKRLVSTVQRGPLVRLLIGRSSARLDLSELGTSVKPAAALLDAIVGRTGVRVDIDPSVFFADPIREQRLRRLVQTAATYRRDTGIHPLYLGFPFLLMSDGRSDGVRPRIASVLLWPVALEVGTGARGQARIAFDKEREEVLLNPAFDALLGAQNAAKWREAAEEILGRDALRGTDVISVLSTLVGADATDVLQPMPSADMRMKPGEVRLRCSAALFMCDFSGQTIARDLDLIARGRSVSNTALEIVIRAKTADAVETPSAVPEVDRYFTIEADPSQQAAVFRARSYPGLGVQGPPGTGKSQTIVNIISDCLGRGERVLVVCQKQAALEVVRKRLAAENLDGRILLIEDSVSDRKPTLLALREQLDLLWCGQGASASLVRARREMLANRMDKLEAALNDVHLALHRRDPGCGYTYREIIEKLLSVEDGDSLPISIAGLRPLLQDLNAGEIEQLCDEVSPLAPVWAAAKFENSALHALRPFGADEAVLEAFRTSIATLASAERSRAECLLRHNKFYELEAVEPVVQWLSAHEQALQTVPAATARDVARWYELLRPSASGHSAGAQLANALENTLQRLERLDVADHDSRISPRITELAEKDLRRFSRIAANSLSKTGLLARLNPLRAFRRRRLRIFLASLSLDTDAATISALVRAISLELALRPERVAVSEVRAKLGEAAVGAQGLAELRMSAEDLLRAFRSAQGIAVRIFACPLTEAALGAARQGDCSAYATWLDTCKASIDRFTAKRTSRSCLAVVQQWMQPHWTQDILEAINFDIETSRQIDGVIAALPTLAAFQRFRIRAQDLSERALRTFSALRAAEHAWQAMSRDRLPAEIRRTVWREALLAWKDRLESRTPALLVEQSEFNEKVSALAELDVELRQLNRELLAAVPDPSRIANRRDWENVYLLQGPRARRLREVVAMGEPLGLFQLRPVWLCSPEMVSRLFELRAGMFDVVIFDEASQLPVENALPALFRAKRVVVSGDEKQLPPTNFFNSRYEADEDGFDDTLVESDSGEMDDASRQWRIEAMNRKEVKDCDDLLALAQTVLPSTTLEIHYRSKFRELIAFSNFAFYSGRLSIPARHPKSKIVRARPIEIIRIDSEYADQTNQGEASRVVDLLQDLWTTRPRSERPSLGVVTFNLKQADLILNAIEERARADDLFRAALEEEFQRHQNGEDMSFFVKNLENVQGDERDWIVFSTTFGIDSRGVFRRNFGVVGQQGGERRLNVAVTRAREKVVLVTSIPTDQVSDFIKKRRRAHYARDFLQAYLDYAEKVSSGVIELAAASLSALSLEAEGLRRSKREINGRFHDEVFSYLRASGYTPVLGTDADAFAVDFAIEDPRTGLFGIGIECDPPTHPLLAAARARELWRPRVLKAAIPVVHRVWSRNWYHDRETEQIRLLHSVRNALTAEIS